MKRLCVMQTNREKKLSEGCGAAKSAANAVQRGSAVDARRVPVAAREDDSRWAMCDSSCSIDRWRRDASRETLEMKWGMRFDLRLEVRDCLAFSRRRDLRASKSSEASRCDDSNWMRICSTRDLHRL